MLSGTYDAIVLGAGIAGSSLAYALAKRGWSVLLLDRRTGSVHKACGEFLSPEARFSIRALGLEEAMDRLTFSPIHKVRLHAPGNAALELKLAMPSIGVSRRLLDEALRLEATAAGAAWLGGATALSVNWDGESCRYRVRIRLGGREEWLTARTVFGAWGRNGPEALTGKVYSDRKPIFRGVGWKVHASGLEDREAVELYCFKGGYIGLSPVGDGVMNTAALLEYEVAKKAPKGALGWLEPALECSSAFRRRFEGARLMPETEQAAAPVRTSDRAVAWSEYPHLGDAAIVIPPLCGDGMAMALRSAAGCAPLADAYLRGAISLVDWKREYARMVDKELAGPARWGRWLQAGLIRPASAKLLIGVGAISPKLAQAAFRATRLPSTDTPVLPGLPGLPL